MKFKIFSLICLLTFAFQNIFAQCDISVGKAKVAEDWNEIFTINTATDSATWTGADSTISLELPNGDAAFFFSDSFVAEYPSLPGDGRIYVNENGLRMREPNCIPPICGSKPEHIHYVFNSIVVRSKDGKTMKTLVGEKDKFGYSTAYFKPKDPKNLYWMGDPTIVEINGQKKIWIFLNEWNVAAPYEKVFRIDFKGQAIAQLDAETLAIENIKPLKNLVDEGVWGISTWLDGKTLYIYGMQNTEEFKDQKSANPIALGRYKKLYVAKTDISKGIEYVSDEKNWQGWNGKKWIKDLRKRASIIPEKASISDELTIRRMNINGKPTFVMVTFDTSVKYEDWKDMYLSSACEPQGPFNNKHVIYTTPTSGLKKFKGMTESQSLQTGLSVYNPHFHPQFTENGEILISYNSNLPFGAAPGDSIYADFYRPRFVRVKIDGLK